jgi:hypothetical protein
MRVLFAPRPAISTTITKTLRHLWFEASRSSHANLASTTRFTLSHDSASLAAISSCLFSLRSTLHLLPTSTPSAQFPRQSFGAAHSLPAAALVRAHWNCAVVVVVRRAWANRISSVGEPVIRCSPIQHRQYGVSIFRSQKPRKDAIQDTPPRSDAQSSFEGPKICPKPCGKAPRLAVPKRTSVSRIEPAS